MRIINVPLLYLFYLLDFHALSYISQKKWNCYHSSPTLCNRGEGGGWAEPFFRMFIEVRRRSNRDFEWELAL